MLTSAKIGLLLIFLQVSFISFGQLVPSPKADTIREFEILRGPSMRSMNIDSVTTLQTIAGGAIIKQGTTIFSSDSVVINPTTHVVEAFGNVHINQADSVQTYAQYLKYIGTEKMAYLKKEVRLNDKKGTVFTQDLDYNLGTGIGNYHNGGKVINGKTTITSKEATYYADTKDVYFKYDVEVTEPKNHITTDSLLYNMRSQGSDFTGNTHIKNKEVDIYTTKGTYDFNTGNALFTTRTSVKDSSGKVYVANNMALDDKSGNAQLEGNAIVKDSVNGFIVFANQIFLNKKNNSFLATRKPVLIIKQNSDSIYVAADTIFSGYSTVVKKEGFVLKKDSVIQDSLPVKLASDSAGITDSLKRNQLHKENPGSDSAGIIARLVDSAKIRRSEIQREKFQQAKKRLSSDTASLNKAMPDSSLSDSNKVKTAPRQIKPPDSIKNTGIDTINKLHPSPPDSNVVRTATGKINRTDSLKNDKRDTINTVAIPRKEPMDTTAPTKIGRLVDSIRNNKREALAKMNRSTKDSNVTRTGPGEINRFDSVKNNFSDTLGTLRQGIPDSNMIKVAPGNAEELDSLEKVRNDSTAKADSSVRYFLAFHHVRIFSDSLQSVCDSLFLSAKDSVFRLYYTPIIWSGHSQITGDTMFLYTKNKKAERLYVFEKGIIINKTTQGFYNQIAGKTINGYFVNGAIDYMRVRGSQSESIYYAQDEDSSYVGMNRATGDVIDLYFKNDDLKKVLFVNDVKGKMYPMKQIPEDQKFLKDFIWLNDKRPKNKLELFE